MTRLAPLALLPLLASCASVPATPPTPIEQFWSALQSHCGNAYAGALVSGDARDTDFRGRRMVAHWAECSEDRTAIAFHIEDGEAASSSSEAVGRNGAPSSSSEAVGRQENWDRSRTWVVTRHDIVVGGTSGLGHLELRHDHRHEDGSEDAVTQYGGLTGLGGTARAQDFPVDPQTIAMFEREGLTASTTNVWRLEVDPAGAAGARFAYQLTRVNDPTRLFRVEFDASAPVAAPPAAWGW